MPADLLQPGRMCYKSAQYSEKMPSLSQEPMQSMSRALPVDALKRSRMGTSRHYFLCKMLCGFWTGVLRPEYSVVLHIIRTSCGHGVSISPGQVDNQRRRQHGTDHTPSSGLFQSATHTLKESPTHCRIQEQCMDMRGMDD